MVMLKLINNEVYRVSTKKKTESILIFTRKAILQITFAVVIFLFQNNLHCLKY